MSNLNPGFTPDHINWNYSNSTKEGYSEQLIGTVQAIQLVQATNFQTRQPEFWSDGNPKMNIRLAVADQQGQLVCFTFQKAGKAAREGKKPSVHMDLWHLTNDTDISNLIGKTIVITTQPGNYGANNPRPFQVAFAPEGVGPFELAKPLPDSFKVPEIVIERPQKPVQGQQPQVHGQFYAAPAPMPQPQQMYAPQPMQMQQQYQPQPQMNQAPMYQQPQPSMNPMQPQVPAGMDPQLAAQMQQMGATNIQPMQPQQQPDVVNPQQAGSVYDKDIPF